jgi:peptidyl-prolyl cis-trans isomerase A (cyclophilin A)
LLAVTLASVLAGCGGGGGGGGGTEPPAVPTVTSIVVGAPRYSQSLLITVNGTRLDLLPAVSSAACTGMQRSTTAPNLSSATTAFYTCTVAATGAGTVSVAYNGSALGSQAYTVPEPQVTLTLANGAGVAGDVVLTLDPTRVKATVDNFLRYTSDGYYSGTIFHRVVDNFVAQGGGYLPHASGATPQLKPGLRAPIALEVGRGLSNVALSVAMARSAAADSATAQFFINLVDNPELDPGPATAGYAVFGQVSAGADVVTALVAAPCAPLAPISECAPDPNVVITAAAQTR